MVGLLDSTSAVGQLNWNPSSNIAPPGVNATTSNLQGILSLRLWPQFVPNAVRLLGISVETTVASDAGGIVRLGVWATNALGFGTTLLSPATGTTVPVDGATGFQEATMNIVLNPGLYWFGAQLEVATVQPTVRSMSSSGLATSAATQATANAGYVLTAQPGGSFSNLSGLQQTVTSNVYRLNFRTGVL